MSRLCLVPSSPEFSICINDLFAEVLKGSSIFRGGYFVDAWPIVLLVGFALEGRFRVVPM